MNQRRRRVIVWIILGVVALAMIGSMRDREEKTDPARPPPHGERKTEEAAARLIRSEGYVCPLVLMSTPAGFAASGYYIWCSDGAAGYYWFELKNHGGRWEVIPP